MKRNIVKISIILVIFVLLAKVLAFIRDPLIAALFGADFRTDAFFGALTITTIVFSFLAPVMTASILPLFIHERQSSESADVWKKMTGLLAWFTLALVGLMAVLILIAPLVVRLVSPGYDAATQVLTVRLVRMMAPLLVAMPLSFFISTLLNAEKRFYLPGALPFISNGVILVVIFLLYKTAGIEAVGWGTLIGALVQLVIVAISAWSRFVFSPGIFSNLRPLWRQIWKVGGPVLVAAVVFNVNFLIMLYLSSFYGNGTYSFLTYGIRIQQVFLDILFASFATVIFPYLSDLASSTEAEKYKDMAFFGIKFFTVILVPVSLLLIVFRVPLTEVIYQRHAVSLSLVQGISTALAFFASSLVAFGVTEIINRAYYAQKDSRTPLLMTIVGTAVAFGLYYTIGRAYSGLGLALAYSLGALTTMLVGLALIHRRFSWPIRTYVLFAGKVVAAGLLCAAAAFGVYELVVGGLAPSSIYKALSLLLAGVIGLVIFGGTLWLLRIDEVALLVSFVRRRFKSWRMGEGWGQ